MGYTTKVSPYMWVITQWPVSHNVQLPNSPKLPHVRLGVRP